MRQRKKQQDCLGDVAMQMSTLIFQGGWINIDKYYLSEGPRSGEMVGPFCAWPTQSLGGGFLGKSMILNEAPSQIFFWINSLE